jgi:energy-coupling factor transporter ATP-binding protein EcfA2
LISKAEKNQFIVVDYDQDGLSDGLYKKVMESIVTLCKDKTHTLVVIHSNRNIQEFFDKRLEVMDGKLIEDKNF